MKRFVIAFDEDTFDFIVEDYDVMIKELKDLGIGNSYMPAVNQQNLKNVLCNKFYCYDCNNDIDILMVRNEE